MAKAEGAIVAKEEGAEPKKRIIPRCISQKNQACASPALRHLLLVHQRRVEPCRGEPPLLLARIFASAKHGILMERHFCKVCLTGFHMK